MKHYLYYVGEYEYSKQIERGNTLLVT